MPALTSSTPPTSTTRATARSSSGAPSRAAAARSVIATKFGMKFDETRQGASREYVRQAAEDSLRRLGTDYIDFTSFISPIPHTPIAETLGAAERTGARGQGARNRLLQFLRGTDPRGRNYGRFARAVCQRAEPVQPLPSRAGSRSASRMRALGTGIPAVFSAGQRPAHRQVPQGSTAPQGQPRRRRIGARRSSPRRTWKRWSG